MFYALQDVLYNSTQDLSKDTIFKDDILICWRGSYPGVFAEVITLIKSPSTSKQQRFRSSLFRSLGLHMPWIPTQCSVATGSPKVSVIIKDLERHRERMRGAVKTLLMPQEAVLITCVDGLDGRYLHSILKDLGC